MPVSLYCRALVAMLFTALVVAGVVVAVPSPFTPAGVAAVPPSVVGLTVNGRHDPLGVAGVPVPSFGWHGESTGRGVVQGAYQLRVALSQSALGTANVWDSGKVVSARQVDVVYGGPALRSQTRYYWQVRTWDGQGVLSAWSDPGWFETGLLAAGDWGNAEWIGGEHSDELPRWGDYTADFTFTIDSLAFGAFLRSRAVNDGYLWQISVADGTPRFRPHAFSYSGTPNLLASVDISSVVSASSLKSAAHTMRVTMNGNVFTTWLDGKLIDTRSLAGGGTLGFVGLRTAAGPTEEESATVRRVKVTAKSGATLLDTDFSQSNPFGVGQQVPGGLRIRGSVQALYRPPAINAMPLLRTDFTTSPGKSVARARVYATARGIYQLALNGDPVGDQHLAPGWTDYTRTIQHQTYDVTSQVRPGANAWSAELGRGWWAGRIANDTRPGYGTEMSLLARLRIDYTDGTTQWVNTDDSSWTTRNGPRTGTDLINGEDYDARFEVPGWERAGFDDSGWVRAVTQPSATDKVVPQPDEPVRTTAQLPAIKRTVPTPGHYVYDLGQEITGVARIELTGLARQTATIRYAEWLNADGTLYTTNLRGAKATDTYTFDADGTATVQPEFTNHGFRYIEITGVQQAPLASEVVGQAWESDLPTTGTVTTSDAMLNQLLSNISWGQRSNFVSIPTDTPARDERLGWTGDINVFAPTASYLRDTRAFFTKWLGDLEATQHDNGDFQTFAPKAPNADPDVGGAGWGDVAIGLPYTLWHTYRDAAAVRRYYPMMQKFFQFVAIGSLIDDRCTFGDWLNLVDSGEEADRYCRASSATPANLISTAYFAQDAQMMSEMAAAIGKPGDAKFYGDYVGRVREAFVSAYVRPDGTVGNDSQTGYAMALGMGLVTDPVLRAKVGQRFVARLAADGNHLTTGFLGTPLLLPALSDIGRDDLAWMLLTRKEYPSWGYEIAKGATTLWERWNTLDGDTPTDNSFNHYAYGAVGDWMFRNIGAIAPLEAGYKKVLVRPRPGGGVDHATGTYESVYGTIRTDWTVTGNGLDLVVDVPVNTTADVVLPGSSVVRESGSRLEKAVGVQGVSYSVDEVRVTVGSGHYHFTSSVAATESGEPLKLLRALQGDLPDIEGAGPVSGADAAYLASSLTQVGYVLEDAVLAELAGGKPLAGVASAERQVADLRAWLASSSVSWEVQVDLDRRLAVLSASVSGVLGSRLNLELHIGGVRPTTSGATVYVGNHTASTLTDVSGTVRIGALASARFGPVSVPATQPGSWWVHDVPTPLPATPTPGTYDTEATVWVKVSGVWYELTDFKPAAVMIDPKLSIGSVTISPGSGYLVRRATVTVPITNNSVFSATARADLTSLPAGWKASSSPEYLLAPGASLNAQVPVIVAADRVGGTAVPATAVLTAAGVTVATKPTQVSIGITDPPVFTYDYIDFGDSASEAAHQVAGSPSSGTGTEAGVTRRYAGSGNPGAWFQATMNVPANKPFILRNRETFGQAGTKRYDVYVDGIKVTTQTVVRGGGGVSVYDLQVDDPQAVAATADGKVVVKYLYPAGSPGDPSLDKSWVLTAPPDNFPPLATATLISGVRGNTPWYRSKVQIRIDAADDTDTPPTIWTQDNGLPAQNGVTGPITLTTDGLHRLLYKATDTAGNTTTGSIDVSIDTTPPTTQLATNITPTTATLTFTATDPTSGIAHTRYRIDGGPWQILGATTPTIAGAGTYQIDYTSTDQAGNPEPIHHKTITIGT